MRKRLYGDHNVYGDYKEYQKDADLTRSISDIKKVTSITYNP